MKSLLKHRRQKPHAAIEPVPSALPVLSNAQIAAMFAGRRIAGDFYDSFRVSPSRVLFGLLDVAGRRAQNEEIFSAAQQIFREVGTELLAAAEVNETDALTQLCLQLNRSILETAGAVHPCPAFAGCYNEELGTVCYFNAGHTPGLARHANDVSELGATGLPLGLFSHTTSDARMIALEPGAALLLVSRGVVEAECNREEFGLVRVEQALQAASRTSAHDLCVAVLDAVQHFASEPTTQEDVTALALIRYPTSS
jgi:sigma-B regulation protein RsbU (phosphoserine phosphatase)